MAVAAPASPAELPLLAGSAPRDLAVEPAVAAGFGAWPFGAPDPTPTAAAAPWAAAPWVATPRAAAPRPVLVDLAALAGSALSAFREVFEVAAAGVFADLGLSVLPAVFEVAALPARVVVAFVAFEAGVFLAGAFRAVAFRAVAFRAVAFRAVAFRAVAFFAGAFVAFFIALVETFVALVAFFAAAAFRDAALAAPFAARVAPAFVAARRAGC